MLAANWHSWITSGVGGSWRRQLRVLQTNWLTLSAAATAEDFTPQLGLRNSFISLWNWNWKETFSSHLLLSPTFWKCIQKRISFLGRSLRMCLLPEKKFSLLIPLLGSLQGSGQVVSPQTFIQLSDNLWFLFSLFNPALVSNRPFCILCSWVLLSGKTTQADLSKKNHPLIWQEMVALRQLLAQSCRHSFPGQQYGCVLFKMLMSATCNDLLIQCTVQTWNWVWCYQLKSGMSISNPRWLCCMCCGLQIRTFPPERQNSPVQSVWVERWAIQIVSWIIGIERQYH